MAYFLWCRSWSLTSRVFSESVQEQLKDQMDSAHRDEVSDGLLGTHAWYFTYLNKIQSQLYLDQTSDDEMVWKYRKMYDLLWGLEEHWSTWVSFALSALSLCSHVNSSFFLCTLNTENTKTKVPVWICHHFYPFIPLGINYCPSYICYHQPINTTTCYY